MAGDLRQWISLMEMEPLDVNEGVIKSAVEALSLFVERLERSPVTDGYLLEKDLFGQIVKVHSGSDITITEALGELENEEKEMGSLLAEEVKLLGGSGDIHHLYNNLASEQVAERVGVVAEECASGGAMVRILTLEAARLKQQCAEIGVHTAQGSPEVRVQLLPPALTAVRAADSYNAFPGAPFKGGIFYVFAGGALGKSVNSVHPSYRMTVAHETFPGHHLLDTNRWNHPNPVIRPLEYPLFYEGWACFGEELMLRSGAFDRVYDRFLLHWRRYRHAIRGKTDLLLHSGQIDLDEGASMLLDAGFDKKRAAQTVRKYALQPGYQMCYTVGRRKFYNLFRSVNGERIPHFMNSVLAEGELLFQDLEQKMQQDQLQTDS